MMQGGPINGKRPNDRESHATGPVCRLQHAGVEGLTVGFGKSEARHYLWIQAQYSPSERCGHALNVSVAMPRC